MKETTTGIAYITGSSLTGTSTTYINTPNTTLAHASMPGDPSIILGMFTAELEKAREKNIMDHLDILIAKFIKVGELTEHDEAALKHLKFAKAHLDKKILDKINETIDGKRNPD